MLQQKMPSKACIRFREQILGWRKGFLDESGRDSKRKDRPVVVIWHEIHPNHPEWIERGAKERTQAQRTLRPIE